MTTPTITPGSRPAWGFRTDHTLSLLDIKELDQQCGYCWSVETRFTSDRNGSNGISVAFVGSRKDSKTYRYRSALSSSENHVAAAAEWLQQLSSLNGAPAYALVAKASTERGYVFTFC
jgi:hypothetical protein